MSNSQTIMWISTEPTLAFEWFSHLVLHFTLTAFPQLAHRLWPLALQDVRVLHALLALLTNLSADCPYAASVLAANTAVSRSHPIACFFPMNQNDPPAASRSSGPARPRSVVGTSSGMCCLIRISCPLFLHSDFSYKPNDCWWWLTSSWSRKKRHTFWLKLIWKCGYELLY